MGLSSPKKESIFFLVAMYKRFFKDSYCPYCDYNLNSILFVSNLNYNSNVYNTL